MNLDYNLILVVLLLLAALIAVMGRWLPKPVVAHARGFFPVLLLVVLVRAFVFELFSIPSPSMMPGLAAGDRIFVAKYSYALRLPVLNTSIFTTGAPQRGDVIVFRLPSDPSTNYIKRLVGLPGDRVAVVDNRVFINGKPMPRQPNGFYAGGYGVRGVPLATEWFGDRPHTLMLLDRPGVDFEAMVPEGHYFFMGDNRNNSQDSRFPAVGFVPERNLVGEARRILFSWRWREWPVWSRTWKKTTLNNPGFNPIEFDGIGRQAGLNT